MASAWKLPINPHTSMTAINMAATVHFLAAIGNGGYFEADVSKNNLLRDQLASTPYALDADGCVSPLERPGIGIEVDEHSSPNIRLLKDRRTFELLWPPEVIG